MSQYRRGVVLGFHGCDAEVAAKILASGKMRASSEEYDWLGPGAYFWEADAERALEWAKAKVSRGAYSKAAVVGAVIDLGHCLDLTTRGDLALLVDAHASLEAARTKAGLPMPVNRDPKGVAGRDRLLRYLDCAVIEHLHENIEGDRLEREARGEPVLIPPFDTVRGLFLEGEAVYPGGGFYTHTHTQIAVRNPENILGLFNPRLTVLA
jgi:hypothetical protein